MQLNFTLSEKIFNKIWELESRPYCSLTYRTYKEQVDPFSQEPLYDTTTIDEVPVVFIEKPYRAVLDSPVVLKKIIFYSQDTYTIDYTTEITFKEHTYRPTSIMPIFGLIEVQCVVAGGS